MKINLGVLSIPLWAKLKETLSKACRLCGPFSSSSCTSLSDQASNSCSVSSSVQLTPRLLLKPFAMEALATEPSNPSMISQIFRGTIRHCHYINTNCTINIQNSRQHSWTMLSRVAQAGQPPLYLLTHTRSQTVRKTRETV